MPALNYNRILGANWLAVLLFCWFGHTTVYAQPDWQVDPNNFEHSMSIIGTVWLNGQELNSEGALVGAFIDETCVGVAQPLLFEATGRYLFFMVVFGNSEHIQEPIQFEIYESGDPVSVQGNLLAFEVDGTIGNVQEPFIIAEPKLAAETDILTFDLGPGMLDVQIENEEVKVSVDISTSLSTLPVSFELSEGAILSVESKQWISGESILNYSAPLKLQVFSEGLFHLKEYTLTVVQERDAVDAHNFISPNGDGYNDFWEISNPDRLANYEFEVRGPEGKVVFRQTGYSIPWDGMFKGSVLPTGTFWYVITNPATGRKLRGFITLIY